MQRKAERFYQYINYEKIFKKVEEKFLGHKRADFLEPLKKNKLIRLLRIPVEKRDDRIAKKINRILKVISKTLILD